MDLCNYSIKINLYKPIWVNEARHYLRIYGWIKGWTLRLIWGICGHWQQWWWGKSENFGLLVFYSMGHQGSMSLSVRSVFKSKLINIPVGKNTGCRFLFVFAKRDFNSLHTKTPWSLLAPRPCHEILQTGLFRSLEPISE